MMMEKRSFIKFSSATIGVLISGYLGKTLFQSTSNLFRQKADPLLEYITPTEKWSSIHLTNFLNHCDSDRQKVILQSLNKEDMSFDVAEILKEIRWLASGIVTYPFRNKTEYNYHEVILVWLAKKFDVPTNFIQEASSFVLERKIIEGVFVKLWDELNQEQRKELLQNIDKSSTFADKAGLALAGGSTALATLAGTAYFTGFAFYTTMSTVIASAAGFFGITLPFAAYAGASTTVGTLTGPVGWTVIGIAALSSAVLLGSANEHKTTQVVAQIHLIKIDALTKSGKLESTLKSLGF